MAADYQSNPVDTLKLKVRIYRRIGYERAEKYFDHLKKFIRLEISKAEFDKSCKQTMGRANLSLNNDLIRAMLRNAIHFAHQDTPSRKAQRVEAQIAKVKSLRGNASSPRKCRSPLGRDRKFRDRPSPLGPLGKSPSLTVEETVSRLQEQQTTAPPLGFVPVEEGEEVEQCAVGPSSQRWSSITAPLGVSFGDRRGPRSGLLGYETCLSSGELPDTRSLGRRLQKKLASQGVGISLDAANLLNKSLDVFLKRIVSASIDIAGSRSGNSFIETARSCSVNPFIGTLAGNCVERPVHMLDFHVAMATSPSMLGADQSFLLEQINNYPS